MILADNYFHVSLAARRQKGVITAVKMRARMPLFAAWYQYSTHVSPGCVESDH